MGELFGMFRSVTEFVHSLSCVLMTLTISHQRKKFPNQVLSTVSGRRLVPVVTRIFLSAAHSALSLFILQFPRSDCMVKFGSWRFAKREKRFLQKLTWLQRHLLDAFLISLLEHS
jgi:hypothetical protein